MMSKAEVLDKVKELIAAPSVYAGLKSVAQEYLAAVGAPDEKAKAKVLVEAVGECVQTIDDVIGFFGSEAAVEYFGKEGAEKMLAHAKEVKAKGGKYCDCPACTAGLAILENKDVIL